MTRQNLIDHIEQEFGVIPDNPFSKDFHSLVFRHKGNKKWFALLMEITQDKLGLKGKDRIDILNLKCDTLLRASVLLNKGIYQGYHMNKNHWITINLMEAEDSDILTLLDLSYEITK